MNYDLENDCENVYSNEEDYYDHDDLLVRFNDPVLETYGTDDPFWSDYQE